MMCKYAAMQMYKYEAMQMCGCADVHMTDVRMYGYANVRLIGGIAEFSNLQLIE